jgi:hypothetical protein
LSWGPANFAFKQRVGRVAEVTQHRAATFAQSANWLTFRQAGIFDFFNTIGRKQTFSTQFERQTLGGSFYHRETTAQ